MSWQASTGRRATTSVHISGLLSLSQNKSADVVSPKTATFWERLPPARASVLAMDDSMKNVPNRIAGESSAHEKSQLRGRKKKRTKRGPARR